MGTTRNPTPIESPTTPAQVYAATAGLFLLALGILSLVIEGVSFGTIGSLAGQPEFLIWSVSGWATVLWIVMGALGLFSMTRLDLARGYAVLAGILFAAIAIWGFIDGNDVVGLVPADTTNNITHAVIGGLGLFVAMLPHHAQRPAETANEPRSGERSAERRQMTGVGSR